MQTLAEQISCGGREGRKEGRTEEEEVKKKRGKLIAGSRQIHRIYRKV